jgi:hypothetical protein
MAGFFVVEDFLPMFDESFELELKSNHIKRGSKPRSKWERLIQLTRDGFVCTQCHTFVSCTTFLSGVVNRNHCPYCLWSRHLDLIKAGDRLAACKGKMKPVALTLKKSYKKYGEPAGEIMLVHLCNDCGKISINRIAADDIAETIFELFERSLVMETEIRSFLANSEIAVLGISDVELVRRRLFGLRTTLHE